MDVLCTDKTGTLTEARIRLDRHVGCAGPARATRVLELAYLNSAFETGLKSPLDDAILRAMRRGRRSGGKVDEVPFDFERRRVSRCCRAGRPPRCWWSRARRRTCCGCSHYEWSGAGVGAPLDAAARQRSCDRCEQLGDEGFRVLGIAWRDGGARPPHRRGDRRDRTGLRRLRGLPRSAQGERRRRPSRSLEAHGVAVKIVTGDNERVTRHVCAELGLECAAC